MPHFKDTAGREWEISLDAPKIMAVRESADPKFLLGASSETYERMAEDPVALCMVIAELCRSQRTRLEMTEEQFYAKVIGDAIDEATTALLEAIKLFIPRSSRRLAEATAATNSKIREMGMSKALAKIEDPELLTKVEMVLDSKLDAIINEATTLPKSATSSPAS